jgi:hypothetical protein
MPRPNAGDSLDIHAQAAAGHKTELKFSLAHRGVERYLSPAIYEI